MTGVEILNIALSHLGIRAKIQAFDEDSVEANACRTHWDGLRDLSLRLHDWNFARVTVRLATLPDTPTLAEQGFQDLDVSAWFGLLAPAATPALTEFSCSDLAEPEKEIVRCFFAISRLRADGDLHARRSGSRAPHSIAARRGRERNTLAEAPSTVSA